MAIPVVGMPVNSVVRVSLPMRAVRSRPSHLRCRAGYSRKTERKVEAPGTALPKDPKPAAEPAEEQPQPTTSTDASSTASTEVTRASSEEEIQQLARKYRELRNAGAKEDINLAQGVLQEIGLIEWPTLQTALFNTALVISMVLFTSVTLFGMNTLLAELARVYYGAGGIKDTIGSLFS